MKTCIECGGKMRTEILEKYHYTECGLDYVYLKNVRQHTCEDCGAIRRKFPKIHAIHHAIADDFMINRPRRLSGALLRYVRKLCGYSSRDFANLIRVDPSTLSRYEHDKQEMSDQLDLIVRFIYIDYRRNGNQVPDYSNLDRVAQEEFSENQKDFWPQESIPAA